MDSASKQCPFCPMGVLFDPTSDVAAGRAGVCPHHFRTPIIKGLDGRWQSAKPDWSRFPWLGAEKVLGAVEFGAGKYTPGDWRKYGADHFRQKVMRHMIADLSGERIDKESGLWHLSHAGADLLFAIEVS